MKRLFTLFVVLGTAAALSAEPAGRSFEADLTGSYSYKDDFGRLSAAPGLALTYGYAIGPTSQLGVTLVRFSPWLLTDHPVYQFSYGLEYKHFWSPSWGDLGPWTPFLGYSLLLDQTLQAGTEGRGMAHHSRLAVGTDLTVTSGQHLVLETGWATASYASFGVKTPPSLSAVHAGLGWRWLF